MPSMIFPLISLTSTLTMCSRLDEVVVTWPELIMLMASGADTVCRMAVTKLSA